VDTCPEFTGRDKVKRLSAAGIKCKYTLLQGIGALMSRTTLVFIAASYVLGNGGVVSMSGTSMLAYMACQYRVPVVAWCESYKFTIRVNIDQIRGNEVGDPRDITHNCINQN
jgi:translation initiation factor eIF-2B subunit delta